MQLLKNNWLNLSNMALFNYSEINDASTVIRFPAPGTSDYAAARLAIFHLVY